MKSQKGFTFIELLLVIVLVLILAASSTTFYGNFFTRNSLQNTVAGFIGQMRKAQIYAMESRGASNWGIHNGVTQLVLFKGTSYAARDVTFDENFTIYSPATISGFTDIIFSRITGTPSATPTIIISTSIATQSLSINSMGVITR